MTPPHVLLVDDDAADAALIVHRLRSPELCLQLDLTVADGPASLAKALSDGPVDVVLLDWQLPGFDGPDEVCRQIHAAQPFASIVVVSGVVTADRVATAFRVSAIDVVPKDDLVRLPLVIKREAERAAQLRADAKLRAEVVTLRKRLNEPADAE